MRIPHRSISRINSERSLRKGRASQVRGFAVESLRRTGDEELRYYLLQLVQALRYEAEDDSRLAAFIVSRASRNPALGILLHW